MVHDVTLLDGLGSLPKEAFSGEAFRATPQSLDPLVPSTAGGRWAPKGDLAVLYTSLVREGALAEIAFHWGQMTPLPSKPATLYRLGVATQRSLRLIRADLADLGVSSDLYHTVAYHRTQEIGAAVAFLGCDGLMVPSARWNCENLVIFADNHGLGPPNRLARIIDGGSDFRLADVA